MFFSPQQSAFFKFLNLSTLQQYQQETLLMKCNQKLQETNEILSEQLATKPVLKETIQEQSIENLEEQDFEKSIINYAPIQHQWSEFQLEMVRELYKEYGPSWTFMSTKLQNRDYKNIKNRFNNGLRKIAKILFYYEGLTYKNTKRSITYSMILTMLSFINELQRSIRQFSLTMNPESKFFVFRQEILRVSLSNKTPNMEEIVEIVRLMKALNLRIRCFGVFKAKCRKNWTLSRKGLVTLCEFDKVVVEQKISTEQQDRQSQEERSIQSEKKIQTKIQSQIFNSFDSNPSLEEFSMQNIPLNVYNFGEYELEMQVCQIQGLQYSYPSIDGALFY